MPLNSPGTAAPCNVTRSSGIMTLNLPGGSTLQCGKQLWNDMPLNFTKRLPYWNSTSVSILTISLQSTCHSAPVSEILYKSDHPRQKKMTSCWFSRWRISVILDFRDPIMGSMKRPCTTSYRSSIDTIALNCLVFEKIAFLHFGINIQDGESPPSWILGANNGFFEKPMYDFL